MPRRWRCATASSIPFFRQRAETKRRKKKRVYYLSIEFLIGRLLFDTLTNLQLVEPTRAALAKLGVDLDRLREIEPDAALGNGGLGRLAACFMDSMAALGIPAYGYGIRYENGLFEQRISDGWQQELPEDWLRAAIHGNSNRREAPYTIGSAARSNISAATTRRRERSGIRPSGAAVPYDTPIAGWRGRHVNMLRLWSARAVDPIHLRLQPRRLRRRHCGAGADEAFRACSIPTTQRRRARSCACGRSISSRRRRCRTSSAAISTNSPRSKSAGAGGDPAQRYASGDRGRRADADPGG